MPKYRVTGTRKLLLECEQVVEAVNQQVAEAKFWADSGTVNWGEYGEESSTRVEKLED